MVEQFDDWLSHTGGVDDECAVVVLLRDFEELGADLLDDIGVLVPSGMRSSWRMA